MIYRKLTTLLASSILVLGTLPAFAAKEASGDMDKVEAAPDEAKISLTGTVTSTADEEFQLEYGGGVVTVELDRFDWINDPAEILLPGENVMVTGTVDDDWFEGRELVANTLQLNDSFVYYHVDPLSSYPIHLYGAEAAKEMRDGAYVTTSGTIKNHSGDRFEVSYQNGSIPVDVSSLGYNPFDNEGIQKLEEGDRVYVYGNVDDDFFDNKGILATGVYELTTQVSSES